MQEEVSKGIKNKNIKLINKKALISYTIEFALKNKQLGKIFVSSDDEKILKIAKKYPIEIIKRPKKYSNDRSREIDAWKHAIHFLSKKDYIFDKMIVLPVTSPLKRDIDIKKSLKKFDKNTDFVVSITKSNRHPQFNMVKVKNGYVNLFMKPKQKIYNRQKASTVYDMTTLFYIVRTKSLLKYDYLFDGKVKYVEIPKNRSIDIDDLYDLKIASIILNNENLFKV